MAFRKKQLRKMPNVITCCLLALLINNLAAGGLLDRRQGENTDKSTVLAVTAPPESSETSGSSSVTESGPGSGSASSPIPTTVPDRPVLATASGNGSVVSTATSSALSSTATKNSSLTEFNDPSKCHVEYQPGVKENPFCKPVAGANLDVNATYEVTWDATLFASGSNVTIFLLEVNKTSNDTTSTVEVDDLFSTTVDSALGYTYINTTSEMLNGNANASLTLLANSLIGDEPLEYVGPQFELLNKTSPGDNSTNSKESSSSSKKLGEKVGIPIGLIFFLVILAALAFFALRYRRNSSGYATSKSLAQRTNTGSTRAAGVAGRGHRRQESFHDEPTSGGVELQPRNHGLTGEDNWDWGRDSIGSPTSPSSGNHFRDELARQKGGIAR